MKSEQEAQLGDEEWARIPKRRAGEADGRVSKPGQRAEKIKRTDFLEEVKTAGAEGNRLEKGRDGNQLFGQRRSRRKKDFGLWSRRPQKIFVAGFGKSVGTGLLFGLIDTSAAALYWQRLWGEEK